MGNPQLTYGARAAGHAGLPVYTRIRGQVLSKACETAAGIDFGKIVSKGSSDGGCIIGGSAPIGVALRDHGQGMSEASVGKYLQKSMVSVLDKDFVWLETVSTSGAYRAKVYYDTATGAVVVTASPSGTQKLIGYLGQTLTAAGLVKVYVDTDMYYRAIEIADEVDANVSGIDDAIAAITPTAPVTELDAAVGNAQSVVTWVDPVDTDLDHVVVQVSVTATGVVSSTRNVAAAAETVTVTGLSNGTGYTVAVWAVDTDGNESDIVTDTVTPSAG
jgi:hypothetical protein